MTQTLVPTGIKRTLISFTFYYLKLLFIMKKACYRCMNFSITKDMLVLVSFEKYPEIKIQTGFGILIISITKTIDKIYSFLNIYKLNYKTITRTCSIFNSYVF